MSVRFSSDPSLKGMSTQDLRNTYLVENLMVAGQVQLNYWETDRTIVGGAVPTNTALELPCPKYLVAKFFCERRELGVINLGGPGTVSVDGKDHAMGNKDGIYIGRGSQRIQFSSADASRPACFYLLSYPAHKEYPIRHIPHASVEGVKLGGPATANERILYRYICLGKVESCQLVMGVTILQNGGVWNTLPPHTHSRRSEAYCYFDVPEGNAVFHFMGQPTETRHLVVRNMQAILSPSWSIHMGVGTASYAFVWGMGGENQEFSDMDPAPIDSLR